LKRDWAALARELRRHSLKAMLNQGASGPARYTSDHAHRSVLRELLAEHELSGHFTEEDVNAIAYDAPHSFKCWSDFPETLPRLRKKYIVASFTILSYRLVIDTARRNGLSWDAVFSCEGIGKYKPLPDAYRAVAGYLQLEPQAWCMVACHNFDLDAAKAVGFKAAFVRRPDEWGGSGPPDRLPNPAHDVIVDSFPELAMRLGVE
jgi:2-haloacid dehalogenase